MWYNVKTDEIEKTKQAKKREKEKEKEKDKDKESRFSVCLILPSTIISK
ncbi:hypothetical protein GCM10008014_11380 [Paenibacillus silvae]|uniref:Uncharacterized protein n=1 Tax=Paenibacillus silvae TaxID=1325358 RepID=A0ABQ1Z3G6_9BACL|nr:hypothetical protein GCM10008014_11380 [Paenibacillus silvae]